MGNALFPTMGCGMVAERTSFPTSRWEVYALVPRQLFMLFEADFPLRKRFTGFGSATSHRFMDSAFLIRNQVSIDLLSSLSPSSGRLVGSIDSGSSSYRSRATCTRRAVD